MMSHSILNNCDWVFLVANKLLQFCIFVMTACEQGMGHLPLLLRQTYVFEQILSFTDFYLKTVAYSIQLFYAQEKSSLNI